MKSKQASKKPAQFKTKHKSEKYVWVRVFQGCCPWQISGVAAAMGK